MRTGQRRRMMCIICAISAEILAAKLWRCFSTLIWIRRNDHHYYCSIIKLFVWRTAYTVEWTTNDFLQLFIEILCRAFIVDMRLIDRAILCKSLWFVFQSGSCPWTPLPGFYNFLEYLLMQNVPFLPDYRSSARNSRISVCTTCLFCQIILLTNLFDFLIFVTMSKLRNFICSFLMNELPVGLSRFGTMLQLWINNINYDSI